MKALTLALVLALGGLNSNPALAADGGATGVRFILLGEVHDNAEQHRLRAAWMAEQLKDGRRSTVVFEQIPAKNAAALAALPPEALTDVEALVELAQLDKKNWRWPLHKPLFEASLHAGAAVAGGNLSREELRPLMKGVSAETWPADLRRLLEQTPWGEAQQTAMIQAIDEGHCGALPAAMQAPMALAQRARDAAMARAMLAAREGGAQRVILIAGNGHVDRELGVPRYLEAAGVPASEIRAIGYLEQGQEGPGRFDSRVLTAPAEREDPCKSLRR
ncbi:ChaN family lipoprotein [Paucibacter sp. DJ1R-11]|uniref:ChaN family lipoprotein n=1 Tax=Paucibacter sp. DJ1R-11 TaxID=2893556 RepID=UPI0021E3B110|nr:ChaN family lipoprotein [Paucibacter sp. DJ1R-11]MCV2362318.1 ChaN family lipoprotein [Paucibacter sp. DJ1R-11]